MILLSRIGTAVHCPIRAFLLATASVTMLHSMPAMAQNSGAGQTRHFDIPAQPLGAALLDYMRQSGVQLTYPSSIIDGRTSSHINGDAAPLDALRQILAGSGITFRLAAPNTVLLENAPAAEGKGIMLGSVSVMATALDEDMATEGSGSYTTRRVNIGRMGESLREIPQSVSVVTRSRMDDLNLNSVNEAIEVTTGAVMVQSDEVNERTDIYFRGLPVDSLRVDGAAVSGNKNVMAFDTAIYDRVEVVRGPSGLFQGTGEPGIYLERRLTL